MRTIHETAFSLLLLAAPLTSPLAAQTDWSSYFGRAGNEWLLDVQLDAAGRIYVCGQTDATTYATPNAFRPTLVGATDAFVACLDPRLPPAQQLVWGTHLGGTGDELATELHVNAEGTRVTVVGFTTSGDFPVTDGSVHAGGQDAFVASFDPSVSGAAQLRWATLLGGSADEVACSVDVQGGVVAVVGTTESSNLPTVAAAQPTRGGMRDLFVATFLPSGSRHFTTYLGGVLNEGEDQWGSPPAFRFKRARVVLDDQARPTVASNTRSLNYPIVNGQVHGRRGNRDIAVTRFDASGQLIYSVLLGGTNNESCFDLRADGRDRIVLAGSSFSSNYIVTPNRLSAFRGNVDAVITHLDMATDRPLYSTYLGGSDQEFALTAYREDSGTFVVAGHSFSADFPITPGASQAARRAPTSNAESYLVRLRPGPTAGSGLQHATWFGGSNQQTVLAASPDGRGGVVAGGPTVSSNFPVTANAFDQTFSGVRDGWVAVHHTLPTGVDRFGTASSPCGSPLFLQVNGAPTAGNAQWAVETHGAPASASGALFLGAPNPAGFSLLGVDLHVGLPSWLGVTQSADASGFATVNLPLPAGFSWNGATAVQSVWLNPGACGGQPLSASNALR